MCVDSKHAGVHTHVYDGENADLKPLKWKTKKEIRALEILHVLKLTHSSVCLSIFL